MSFTSFLVVVAISVIAALIAKRAYNTFFASKQREKAEKKNGGGTPFPEEKEGPNKK